MENTRYETLASTLESLVKAGVDVQLEMPEEEKVAKPEPDPEEEKPQFDKRIPYTVIRSSRLSKPNDVRYIVVNLNDKDQVLTMQADTDTSRFLPHRRATDINAGISPSTGKLSTRQSPKPIFRSRRAVSSRSGTFEKEGLYDLQRSIFSLGSGGVPEPWL